MARTPSPRLSLLPVVLACRVAACGGAPPAGGSGGAGETVATAPTRATPAAPAAAPAAVATAAATTPAASHPLPAANDAPAPAVDPVPAPRRPQASILSPSRPRAPLIREPVDPRTIVAPDAAGPDAPYAKADATPARCGDPRPSACNLDYKPVCADVDTGVRCIRAPCPSSERKTFSSACKACRDPAVSSYVAGRCPPAA
jgi:hypothetical protein